MESTKEISEKKRKRFESKKKKAEAFLALVGHTSEKSESEKTKETDRPSGLLSTYWKESESDSLLQTKMSANGSTSGTASMDPVEEMKAILRERKKAIMQKPKFFLTLEEMVPFRPMPLEPVAPDEIPPLFVMDLQQLLLNAIQGNKASFKPRWCKILRMGKVTSSVLLMVDGLSYDDYNQNKELFPNISNHFENMVEMVCPLQYGQSVEEELMTIPLSVTQLKKAKFKVPEKIASKVAEKIAQPVSTVSVPEEKFSRLCLLLSTYQMKQEGYPLPIQTTKGIYRRFKFSRSSYEQVHAESPMFAVDCEMCFTTARKNELTRVSIVSEEGEVLYDTLVKPRNKIINYLTKYSGITKKMLDPVTTRIDDVQRDIANLLPPDAILCGQSLNSDLMALHLFHPYVIDTSVIYNMSGIKRVKTGLRKLTQFFLGRTIQASANGHCSSEDATATLDLVKLKLSKGLEFGDATMSGIYFPDIKTYFTGSNNNGKATSENVEQESTDQTSQPDSATSQPNSVTSQKSDLVFSSSSEDEGDNNHTADSNAPPCKKIKLDNDAKDNAPNDEVDNAHILSTVKFSKVQQEEIFNQTNSVHVPHSLFRLTQEAGRTAVVIDSESALKRYQSEPVEKLAVATDSEVRSATKQCVQKKEFVMAQFKGPTKDEMSDPELKQKMMKKLDKRIHSVLKKIPPNALVALVFKGRSGEDAAHNMATFVKTT